ncbi:MAG: DeoR/GlpR family DNA-binding transcription regulator [Cyclobacteriaceae bacterium]
MLREERLQFILEKLSTHQKVSSGELMELLNVSEGTIRRDLNELEEKGLLRKVYGGAVPKPEAPPYFENRVQYASQGKEQLAQKAVRFIKNGQTILIDGGTTNWHIARQIPENLELTVFTNSIPIANELSEHPLITLFMLGGRVFKGSKITYGPEVADGVKTLRADLGFIGIRSIHAEAGATTLDYEEAYIKRLMVERSGQVIVAATQDKLNTADHYLICGCDAIDTLIVEDGMAEESLVPYQKFSMEIL